MINPNLYYHRLNARGVSQADGQRHAGPNALFTSPESNSLSASNNQTVSLSQRFSRAVVSLLARLMRPDTLTIIPLASL